MSVLCLCDIRYDVLLTVNFSIENRPPLEPSKVVFLKIIEKYRHHRMKYHDGIYKDNV